MRARFVIDNALLVALVALSAFFALKSSSFLDIANFKNITINSAILSIVVVAMTPLVIAGHLDLSVGSNVGLAGVMTSLAVVNWQWNPALAIGLGIVVSTGVGAINGGLCAILGFSPIIVTLGMLGAVRGGTLLVTNSAIFGLGEPFRTLGSGEVAGVPILVIFSAAALAVGGVFLGLTPWGRYVYAIGVNPQAAFLSGLPVRVLPFLLYAGTGAAAGLAGVLFASRLDGASPGDMGIGMEISALTAVLLGGVAFAGGRGSLLGVLVAVLFLGVLQNGLLLMNVQPFVQQLTQGLVLVAAAGLDAFATLLSARQRFRTQVDQRPREPAVVMPNAEHDAAGSNASSE